METFLWTPESNWGFVCLSLHSGYATDNNLLLRCTTILATYWSSCTFHFIHFSDIHFFCWDEDLHLSIKTNIHFDHINTKKDRHQAIHEQVDRTQKSQNRHTHTTHRPLVQKLRQIHDNRLDHFKYTDAWNLILHLGVKKFKFQGSFKSKIYKENNPVRGKKWTKRQIHTLELAFMDG